MTPLLWFLLAVGIVLSGFIGAVTADNVRDRGAAGFFLGLLLGPLGWFAVLLLKDRRLVCGYCGAKVFREEGICRQCARVVRPPADNKAAVTVARRPVSRACPKCGSPKYHPIRSQRFFGFTHDRLCVDCRTPYAPMTPQWVAVACIVAGSLVGLVFLSWAGLMVWARYPIQAAVIGLASLIPFLFVVSGVRGLREKPVTPPPNALLAEADARNRYGYQAARLSWQLALVLLPLDLVLSFLLPEFRGLICGLTILGFGIGLACAIIALRSPSQHDARRVFWPAAVGMFLNVAMLLLVAWLALMAVRSTPALH